MLPLISQISIRVYYLVKCYRGVLGFWHDHCFVCHLCELPITSRFQALDGRPACHSCYTQHRAAQKQTELPPVTSSYATTPAAASPLVATSPAAASLPAALTTAAAPAVVAPPSQASAAKLSTSLTAAPNSAVTASQSSSALSRSLSPQLPRRPVPPPPTSSSGAAVDVSVH